MNILQITAKLPYPPQGGGRIEIFNSLKYLSRKHEITLLTLVDSTDAEVNESIPMLKQYCQEVITVPHTYVDSAKDLILNIFSKKPYTMVKYRSTQMVEKLQRLIKSHHYDLVRFDSLHMAYYLDYINGLPAILRAHNVESHIMYRFFMNAKNPLVKSFAFLQWRKLKKYEALQSKRFDMCVMISEVDKQLLSTFVPDGRTEVITAGVDTDVFFDIKMPGERNNRMVFTGEMAWKPNEDAVIWFSKEVFPRIREEMPDAVFYIVGRDPTPKVRNLQSSQIIVTGRVEDVSPYVRSSSVFLTPIRIGGGMRLKILEAMAMGVPVVSTSIGCEGIAVTHKKNIIIADTSKDFADAAIMLMKDKELAQSLANEAKSLIKSKYSWNIIAKQFDEIYHSVAGK